MLHILKVVGKWNFLFNFICSFYTYVMTLLHNIAYRFSFLMSSWHPNIKWCSEKNLWCCVRNKFAFAYWCNCVILKSMWELSLSYTVWLRAHFVEVKLVKWIMPQACFSSVFCKSMKWSLLNESCLNMLF